MALVSLARYQVITGDESSAASAVSARLEDAQRLLEEHLQRPLETGQRTEVIEVMADGRLFPKVTPVTAVSAPSGLPFVAGYMYAASPDVDTWSGFFPPTTPPRATVTYTAGFDPAETDPDAVGYLPRTLERAIAWGAYVLLRPDDFSSLPPGAVSVSLGDASISYGSTGGGGAAAIADRQLVWPASVRPWKRKRA